ncbi:secreted protein [methanotrophic bacterial endosymbiont of Bathymodiolus sp.]|jgi:di/tricarboxylate transporter|nr:secreted protein [methanotrophic bacterial endosymbiont of Bathymodiolus sp.]
MKTKARVKKRYKKPRKHKAIILFGVFILATSLWAFYELTKPKVATEWFDSRVYNKPKISLPKGDGYHANKMVLQWPFNDRKRQGI